MKETECIVTISDEIKEVNGFNYICATVTLSDYDQNIIETVCIDAPTRIKNNFYQINEFYFFLADSCLSYLIILKIKQLIKKDKEDVEK